MVSNIAQYENSLTNEIQTWNGNEHADMSHILNGFDTNLSRIPSSQSEISPLFEPTAQWENAFI